MSKKRFKSAEWNIIICTIILIIIGLFALYSASKSTELEELKKQVIWIVVSIPILVITAMIDYKSIAKISIIFYLISIILLVAVLLTSAINGASSWFNLGPISIQPGEIAKIAVVLFLANTMAKMQHGEINKFTNILKILVIGFVPIILIVMQPDYGTAFAYVFAMIAMLFVSGIDRKYIIVSIILVIILVPLLYFFVLPEHAKARIDVYLNPESDPRGAGYNIIQSKLAIGAGRLFGLGWTQGTQTQLGFLYPKTTDFIFSVIGEEFGFIACIGVVMAFIVLITKSISIAKTAVDPVGSYIAIGIVGIFLFHIIENIGMTMGLLPITGVPLPFISYGGSSLLTNMICIGLLISIARRRKKSMFED